MFHPYSVTSINRIHRYLPSNITSSLFPSIGFPNFVACFPYVTTRWRLAGPSSGGNSRLAPKRWKTWAAPRRRPQNHPRRRPPNHQALHRGKSRWHRHHHVLVYYTPSIYTYLLGTGHVRWPWSNHKLNLDVKKYSNEKSCKVHSN